MSKPTASLRRVRAGARCTTATASTYPARTAFCGTGSWTCPGRTAAEGARIASACRVRFFVSCSASTSRRRCSRLDAVGLGPGETCVAAFCRARRGESALAWCEMAASAASGEDFGGDFDGDFEDECVAALSRVCGDGGGVSRTTRAGGRVREGEERACGEDAAALVLASELRALTGFVEWAKKRKGRKLRRMNE